jgi:putative DNA primase/helicase
MNSNKYILNPKLGWLEYDNNNILIMRGDKPPSSMLNDITNTLQELLTEQRNLTFPTSTNDIDYKNKMKIFSNAYNKVGTSSYIKGIIDYLNHLYTNDRIDELIDSNKDLVAFNNMLYDNKIKDFRLIKPSDYISKTCRYDINTKSNPVLREKLISLIKSMFENDEIYNYHLKTISLSLFGNKTESFIINSGKGRNGKGVCSTLIENAFGDYFYSGESTFLTTVYKADRPNSTLYNLRGVRYFLTTEPEADNETKFNIGLIKKITGNDTITTRDLHKTNISYVPQFTPFLQCNTKPKIDNIDDAIKNRFRIINFPFAFVNNPTKPNEKQGNINLKESLTKEMYNEFMLLLLDINKSEPLNIPKSVLNEVDDYLNTNNHVKLWLDCKFEYTTDRKDCFSGKELLMEYNQGDYPQLTNIKFAEMMKMNNISVKLVKGNKYYWGLKLKEFEEEEINNLN